ncbi:MAG: hypothetical protein BMS9Abin12_1990 [Acidimicrobiia bacterium]|nr:MAG: hypothetical protein BMS9Abin12_1990 [Acidimicrobiia bacterium]
MNPRSLEEDLLDIPGVEGAEIQGAGESPAGLRIRIADGADQRAVGGAIRRVLTTHGLGTDTQLPGEEAHLRPEEALEGVAPATQSVEGGLEAPDPSDDDQLVAVTPVAVLAGDAAEMDGTEMKEKSGAVIDLTDPRRNGAQATPITTDREPVMEASSTPGSWASIPSGDQEEEEPGAVEEPPSPLSTGVVARIDRVTVEEGRGGITVTVSSADGRAACESASSTEGGVESAVVKAAARLARPGEPDPTIIEIEDRRIEGVDIVMIVLNLDGTVAAGAAIVGAGRSFALGRATWAALSL